MSFRASLILLLLGLSAGSSRGDTGKISALLGHSPFGRTQPDSASTVADAEPLEFRAVLEENAGLSFCLYEAAAHRSAWVGLQQPENGVAVKSYDDTRATVLVEYQGRTLTLALKRLAAVTSTSPSRPLLAQTGAGTEATDNLLAPEGAAPAPSPDEIVRERSAEAVLRQYREIALRQRSAR